MVLSAAIFITLVGLIIYLHFVKIDQESLLVIGSLGIQLTSSYASGKESTTFIEMSRVKDVVINEAIYMVISVSCVSVGTLTSSVFSQEWFIRAIKHGSIHSFTDIRSFDSDFSLYSIIFSPAFKGKLQQVASTSQIHPLGNATGTELVILVLCIILY